MSEIKLLPCPFCGRKAELRYNKDGFVYILCANDGCYARTDGCLNENEASRLWNTRKPMERIIERLEEEKRCCEELAEKSMEKPFSMDNSIRTQMFLDRMAGFNDSIQIVKEEGGIE